MSSPITFPGQYFILFARASTLSVTIFMTTQQISDIWTFSRSGFSDIYRESSAISAGLIAYPPYRTQSSGLLEDESEGPRPQGSGEAEAAGTDVFNLSVLLSISISSEQTCSPSMFHHPQSAQLLKRQLPAGNILPMSNSSSSSSPEQPVIFRPHLFKPPA